MLSKMAHKLKSTLDSMGVHSIAPEIRAIEHTAKNKELLDKIPGLVSRLNEVVTNCIEQIKQDLLK